MTPRRAPGKPPRTRRIVLASLLLLLLAAGAELTLRFIFGLGNPVLVTPDPASDYVLKPNQNVDRFFCHTRTNRYGMRSAPFAPLPGPDILRLLFVGDSVTYGTSRIDQSDLFTQILGRELPSIVHHPVEILNASAGAWAIDNEVSWVRSRGTFHAKTVLLVLNSGDPGQPRARISDLSDDTTQNHPATAIGELWTRLIAPRIFHIARRSDAGDTAQSGADTIIRANLADLDDLLNTVETGHARLAIIYLPFRKEIPTPARQAQTVLRTWADAHRVPFFDLTSVESQYPTRDITLDGDHLSRKGNAVVAHAIEQQWAAILGS